ncbi:MAG: hypothetical protein CSYNP_02709 [Syntrophus sp. SKADARSKE-3]|nr:hypothetical protein [Syntrophus sp. SKADARSKE-3]
MKSFYLVVIFIMIACSGHAIAAQDVYVLINGKESPEAVTYQQDSTKINVVSGSSITITVEANPTTGYGWQLADPLQEKIIVLSGHRYKAPKANRRVGVGGWDMWLFKTVGAGKTIVTLEYVRSWEKGVAPVKKKVFVITVSPSS